MVQTREELRFLLNGKEVVLQEVGASDTLLDFLRIERRLTGTKEGCAEGDCGACTVLVGRLAGGALRYEPINACIRFMASLDGCHVVTIEYLRGEDGALHPVQQAMVDLHASQCGFCTPGFVMSLYALWMSNPCPSVDEVETALQGNLCRCTGYEPIVKAAMAAGSYGAPAHDALETERAEVTAILKALSDGARVSLAAKGEQAILPADVDDLALVLADKPEATIIAGATDVGLWVTKHLSAISPAIHIAHLEELHSISEGADGLRIGAAVSYSDCEAALVRAHPHLSAYWARIAGWQVRNMGTVGGNIANGSPIGDTPPVLIALGASITLRKGAERRQIALEDYFIAYGKQDRVAGEFIESIHIPHAAENTHSAAYKISKRRDEDISSVAAGFSVELEGGQIVSACLAYGGMAATPKRAKAAEAALIGQGFSEASMEAAALAIAEDFTPLSDWRASADYRMKVAQNLLKRFYLESQADAPARLERAR